MQQVWAGFIHWVDTVRFFLPKSIHNDQTAAHRIRHAVFDPLHRLADHDRGGDRDDVAGVAARHILRPFQLIGMGAGGQLPSVPAVHEY